MRPIHAALVACAVAAAGCAHSHKEFTPATQTVTVPGVISCWGNWIKDKGDKFDVSFSIRNDSPDAFALVFLSDISGGRGDAEGTVRHSAWAGERTIDMRPGQLKTFTLTCGYQREVHAGDYRIEIHKVFENPTHDGRTPGKVVAENVVWTGR